MQKILNTFLPLYTTTLLMLLGSGLLTTYVSLRLAHENISGTVIGLITAAHYIGLVVGGKVGHNLIARVGHIRAYVACAGIITASVIGHGLSDYIPVWIVLRFIIGLCMMSQYMVLESWLNDQAESNQRGVIFGLYMVATYLGLSAGQIILTLQSGFGMLPLLIVALCFALCLVPIALTTRTKVHPMSPAPLELGYFLRTIPRILVITLLTGMVTGAFYGMAPVYASQMGFTTSQTGIFMAATIFAGLVTQFPLSWLSDRYDRQRLLFFTAVIFLLASLPLAALKHLGFAPVTGIAFVASMMQFALYPLAVALANDRILAERRVSLTACLLMSYGIGASIGPLLTGALMQPLGGNMLYAFFVVCCAVVIGLTRLRSSLPEVTAEEQVPHVPLTDGLVSSPLAVALNPAIDEEDIQNTMVNLPEEELNENEASPPEEEEQKPPQ
ncbi:MFS transporter [Tatumella citrea]|uniref:MFS transporter n=1 Tax=Tatumella citrea TaxID=53336 RepID=A0A1Y0LMP8_TATCI|nr:MFS transporter [Tatumella citrea]ARU95262.1 MFS transporter [Tatumella citrea]ARU99302.1 MFS transporter [Tatumella citrea]